MFKRIVFIFLTALITFTAVAKEKTYVRDYTYQASDTDSKVSARNASLLFLKQNLLSEIGTYVGSSINIVSVASGSSGVTVSAQQIKSLTEGFIKTEILEQKWNGVTFYIKAKMIADPDAIAKKLKEIAKASNSSKSKSNEEFEYWKSVVQIDSNEAYLNYMKKYPSGKYQELAEIAIVRLLKEKMDAQKNKKWLVKPDSKFLIVARHDTGTMSDLDRDDITRQMADTVKTIATKYVPTETKIQKLVNFDLTRRFLFDHKEYSAFICKKEATDFILGAVLEDHEGTNGMSRFIRLFIRSCDNNVYRQTRFVPKSTSNEDFWRRKSVEKHLRPFIQDYIDTL